MSNRNHQIQLTEQFVYEQLKNENSGHDWWHIKRVWNTAKVIGKLEAGNLFVIEMAALLHDIADEKLNDSEEIGLLKVRNWLQHLEIEQALCDDIIEVISTISYKGGKQPSVKTIEAKIVQDADRLDAIGAIGIARTFAYAGAKGDLIYDPELPYRENLTKEEYRNGKSTAINHFYEKLLKLTATLNTNAAREMARTRHEFMEQYLEQFFKEWNGQL
ncbi:HD domain-containing protein [Bacillus sp. PS06]|uniref:HD domain-containing protein n=1 Tax=Bacillus sp. PS06 TaxID=2764176 RepID=UPI001786CA32|nr:HD domain-containing protein [Bacillus sp. PS06]MBD8068092.1 HD domain-containing protein [Bacillus sp. PS06]